MRYSLLVASCAFAVSTVGAAAQEAPPDAVTAAAPAAAEDVYREIEETLGVVPSFMKAFPEVGIRGAWDEFKSVQLNPDTALSGKEKELIGLGVAAQVPCDYCVYAHTRFAKMNGATDQEIREALAMAAITRHWSTVLNGSQISMDQFRQEIDEIARVAEEGMSAAETQPAQ